MKRPTVVYYPAPSAALTSEDLRGTFATLHRSDPLPRAAATIAVTDPRLSERAAGICAGRIAEIASLQAELAGYLAHK